MGQRCRKTSFSSGGFGVLRLLRPARGATTEEALSLIEDRRLYDSGCGPVDISLLASALLTPGASLWTLDRSLEALAGNLGVAFEPRRH